MKFKKGIIVISLIILASLSITVVVIFRPWSTHVVKEMKDPKEAIRNICKELQKREFDKAGCGTAITTIETDYEKKRFLTEFKFKGPFTRIDEYIFQDKKKGERIRVWAVNDKNRTDYQIETGSVYIKDNGGGYQYCELGHNFHPQTFNQIHGMPVFMALGFIHNGKGDMRVYLDDMGFEHIEHNFEQEDKKAHFNIILDPEKAYNLVAWDNESKNFGGSGASVYFQYHADWEQKDGMWYISKVTYEEDSTKGREYERRDDMFFLTKVYYSIVDSLASTFSGQQKHYRRKVHIEIKEFTPDPQIDDAVFTLDGLGIPEGTKIINEIEDTTYRYKRDAEQTKKASSGPA